MKKLILLVFVIILFASCTGNQMAKKYGGTYKIELPRGQKLVDVTWKGDNLWYLIRERRLDEKVETFTFKEDSSYGLIEGKVVFVEQ